MNKFDILDGNKKQYRKFNILFGDLVTDCKMDKKMNIEESIRIGFLDKEKSEMLEDYKDHFDIIVLGEGDFYMAIYMLKHIFGLK